MVATSSSGRDRVIGALTNLFFVQAEDGIRDYKVTGVQTCALPISSFGDIFRTNAVNNGLAPVALPAAEIARLREPLAARNELTVDLQRLDITHPDGLCIPFELDAHVQETLVHGLDDIARTLQREGEIDAYETSYTPRFDVRALPV